MKRLTVTFRIETQNVNSAQSQEVIFDFDDNATQDEMEFKIDESYDRWLREINAGGWKIDNTEIIEMDEK